MRDFLDFHEDRYVKKEVSEYTDKFDNKINWVDKTFGKTVRCFVLSVPEFKEWYRYATKNNLPLETYKEIPITIKKSEMELKYMSVLIKDKVS